ncbi:MAG: GNAT family N-acetyltransferase [Promethearchaeota archaeon]
MIHVESRLLSPKDCDTLGYLTVSSRKGTILESDRSAEEIAANIETLAKNQDYEILIALDENQDIIGWIYYYVAIPPMAFINGYLPIADQTRESGNIILALINASKRNIIEREYTRLEINNDFPTDAHKQMSDRLLNWYKKCDFQFAAEEAHMKTDLRKIRIPENSLPNGYSLQSFSEISYDQLEIAGFQALQNSNDELFISMSQSEQKVSLKYFFDKSRNFIKEASLVLEKDGRVVGFVITRVDDDIAEIGPFDLIPEVRGHGLGNYLLGCALKNIKDAGFVSVSLDVSKSNIPAKMLYNRYGFEELYSKQFYFWSP